MFIEDLFRSPKLETTGMSNNKVINKQILVWDTIP